MKWKFSNICNDKEIYIEAVDGYEAWLKLSQELQGIGVKDWEISCVCRTCGKDSGKFSFCSRECFEKAAEEINLAFTLIAPSNEAMEEFAAWASEIEANFDDFENDEELTQGIV